MRQMDCDVAVIGAGPAGLAAAIAAKKQGAAKVMIIERDAAPGGILQQCIHPGFGLQYFKEELTGPEYAARFIEQAEALGVEILRDTMVLELLAQGKMICVSAASGVSCVTSKSIVLAMGCRERTRGNIMIPGTRPAGIFTAGTAQRLINRQNTMVGHKVVILGSGDIGMIMARRLTLEGAQVVAVVEIMDYLAGLTRNRVQCLDDFDIPLLLGHTVVQIVGTRRVEGVWVALVNAQHCPIQETKQFFECDTLLLSVGLIPENELSRMAGIEMSCVTGGPVVNQYMQTTVPEVFACGNVVHVNDLVDNVSLESETAGRSAAQYAAGMLPPTTAAANVVAGENVRYVCPQRIAETDGTESIKLFFRVCQPDRNVVIRTLVNGKKVSEKKAAIVNPGEMQHVSLKMSMQVPDEIRVDVLKEV